MGPIQQEVFSNITGTDGGYRVTVLPACIDGHDSTIPDDCLVLRNYPNPFNPSTMIYYQIPVAGMIEMSIYNILGGEIKTIPARFSNAGPGLIAWDGTDNQGNPVAAGLYACRLKAGGRIIVHKMMLSDGNHGAGSPNTTGSAFHSNEMLGKPNAVFHFNMRISGNAFPALELAHLSCAQDTTIDVRFGHADSRTIGPDGGALSLENGFSLSFQEGSYGETTTVTVMEAPASAHADRFPENVTRISPVMSVMAGNADLQRPALVSFDIAAEFQQHADSTLAIYRWDGSEWSFAGGIAADNTISTYVRDFSFFVAGYQSVDSRIYRLFRFMNQGLYDAMVYVRAYQLLHPEWDVPITEDSGVPCFAPPIEPVHGNLGWYPQGWYQFCADWKDDVFGWRHRIIGGSPPHWTYFVHGMTSLIAPPLVHVNTGFAGSLEGRCPCEITQIVLGQPSIDGSWDGELNFFGRTIIQITRKKWFLTADNDKTEFPVVQINEDQRYVILWDHEDAAEYGLPYIKFTWSFTDEKHMRITIYDTHATVTEAVNDDEPEVSGMFTWVSSP